jgi:glycosyltransferase involved in cell wall biosynthesis
MQEKCVLAGTLVKLDPLRRSTPKKLQLHRPRQLTICTEFYPPDYAATGQLIEELALQLEQVGMPVHIFTGQPGYAFQKSSAPSLESTGKLRIRRSSASRLWHSRIRGKGINGLLFFLRAAVHLLNAKRRDDLVLLTTAPPFLPILGYLANLFLGLPYICLIYDLYPDIAIELKVVPAKHGLARLWNWLNKKVWKRANHIIALSSTMKDRMQAHCPGIDEKISVIHNWANPDWITPIPKQSNWFAQHYDLVDTFTVLYSGNMGRCHDMDTILEAALQLQHEPIRFLFIGEGAKRRDCIEQVQNLGLKNCKFLPYQEKQDLPYSLTACDLSLVSINFGMEGLVAPSKFYGTLAAGRPVAVVCEPHSYLRTLVADAKCGATFRNGNGIGLANFIRFLASDRQVANQMGTAGRQYLQKNFTPEIIAQEYLKVLAKSGLNVQKQPDSKAASQPTLDTKGSPKPTSGLKSWLSGIRS